MRIILNYVIYFQLNLYFFIFQKQNLQPSLEFPFSCIHNISFVYMAVFKIFFLPLILSDLLIMCLSIIFFIIFCLGFIELLVFVDLQFYKILKYLVHHISTYFIYYTPILFRYSNNTCISVLEVITQLTVVLFCLKIFF